MQHARTTTDPRYLTEVAIDRYCAIWQRNPALRAAYPDLSDFLAVAEAAIGSLFWVADAEILAHLPALPLLPAQQRVADRVLRADLHDASDDSPVAHRLRASATGPRPLRVLGGREVEPLAHRRVPRHGRAVRRWRLRLALLRQSARGAVRGRAPTDAEVRP